ncbi:hypothetical protein AWE51_22365 [Aquimarina aggregata]|uniref:Short-chain dehydrogenase n=1 Tax=Aquimarina aggregata TaxID=1642818 RepID=A0A163BJ12_9FLAO|nr:SDR family oxidoreductase [Aquimarina aggregata]KZS41450.1 hypothetical protein AWE51_22365 [Aquimarina aggregata]
MDTMFSLKEKTIVVTGASSGIGKCTSIAISKAGGRVVLIGRNEDRLIETFNKLEGIGHSYYTFDLLNFSEIKSLVSRIVTENGKIDGLVNSAGVESTVPLKVLSYKNLEETFKINVFSGIELTKHFSNKKNFSSKGSIIFLSSVMGSLGEKGKIAYCGSKAAVKNMIKPLALELADKNIRVNSISPGLVMTEMTDKLFASISEQSSQDIINKHPLGIGTPNDVASLCIYLLSNSSRWVTGTDIIIDGGYSIS